MTDHLDSLRDDLKRLDQRIRDTETAYLDHRVTDLQAWRETRKRLHEHQAELRRAIQHETAREQAEHGGDAA